MPFADPMVVSFCRDLFGINALIFSNKRRNYMAKPKQKPKKREETTEEFLKRVNDHKEWGKRNGLKRRHGRHHR